MTPKQNLEVKIAELEKEFDEKYCEREGCQADHDGDKCLHCNVSPCPHCKQWGGKQGRIDDKGRPNATAKEIKSFYRKHLPKLIESVVGEMLKEEDAEQFEAPENCGREAKGIACTSCPEMKGRANGYRRAIADFKSNLKMFIE